MTPYQFCYVLTEAQREKVLGQYDREFSGLYENTCQNEHFSKWFSEKVSYDYLMKVVFIRAYDTITLGIETDGHMHS